MNLIISGSVFTLMEKIFKDEKEPLFGRADLIMKLNPFTTDVLREILGFYLLICRGGGEKKGKKDV